MKRQNAFCVVKKFGVSKIITLIPQIILIIKLIKGTSEDIYGVTKDFYFS